jgi:hypothetical protein
MFPDGLLLLRQVPTRMESYSHGLNKAASAMFLKLIQKYMLYVRRLLCIFQVAVFSGSSMPVLECQAGFIPAITG